MPLRMATMRRSADWKTGSRRNLGFPKRLTPCPGRPISRKLDAQMSIRSVGRRPVCSQDGHDCGCSRHRKEVEEPFEAEQIGSSAMALQTQPDAGRTNLCSRPFAYVCPNPRACGKPRSG